MNSSRTVLAAGAALLVVGAATWLLMRGPGRAPAPSSPAAARRTDDAAPLAPAAGSEGSPLTATREADAAHANAANPSELPLAAPGKVHLKIADALTQATLEHARARFLGETRFAESSGDHEVTASLTAGAWEASVSVPGFEPARLGPFEVKPGETLELGTIALGRGSGLIEGHVTARHLQPGHDVIVQLYGEGRAPCDRCLELRAHPPATEGEAAKLFADCGFGDPCSEWRVRDGGTFRFEHLAAGVYWLRATEDEQRIAEARRIEIDRGGRVWQEIDVSAPTTARFELRHAGGGLFTGAWSEIHVASPAPIHYEFRRHGRSVGAVDVNPTAADCLASVGPPIPIPGRDTAPPPPSNQRRFVLSFVSAIQSAINTQISEGKFIDFDGANQRDRDDRARAEGDALLFDGGEPDCDGVSLAAKAIRPDLHEVAPLPRAELAVIVSCGSYRSEETPLDLRSDPFQPFVLSLDLEPDLAARMPDVRKGPPASCNACHGSESPTDGHVNYGAPKGTITLDLGDLGGETSFGDGVELQLPDLSGAIQATSPSSDPKPAGDH